MLEFIKMNRKVIFIAIITLLLPVWLCAVPALPFSQIRNTPEMRDLAINNNLISDEGYKPIMPWEYPVDFLILYSGLWLTAGITAPMWDTGVSLPSANDSFADRLMMEPFNTRKENVFSVWYDASGEKVRDFNNDEMYVPNGTFYAKNIVEPLMFTYMALYLRSKNYNIALMIGEIFTLSILYEFTVRPVFRVSSFEQLLKNPAVGILAGILIDEIATYLLTTPNIGLHALAYILNPFKALPTSRVHGLIFLQPYTAAVTIAARAEF